LETTTRPSSAQPAPAAERPRQRGARPAALLVVVGALAVTAAWIYLVVLLVGWVIAAIF
jgi:hypothetical protein